MSVIVACMPLLVVYPVAIIGVAFGLARRVAEQNRRLEELGRTDVRRGSRIADWDSPPPSPSSRGTSAPAGPPR